MSVKSDINKLVEPDPRQKPLAGAVAPTSMPSKTGVASRATKSGSGIVGPIKEQSREMHVVQAVSSDGLFVWSVPKIIAMIDGEGAAVDFEYKVPV